MELTRAQEQRISQLEEFRAETRQKFDVILGMLSRLQGNQRSDDQFTLDLSTTPSVKAKGSGSDNFDGSGNDRMSGEIREGLVHKAILKENSNPQFQVPTANSEIVGSIEPHGKVDLGLEKLEHVGMNENLAQVWVQKKVKVKLEVNGVVERGQKMIGDANTCCAHKVFVKMPSKEKRMKHLKAWKFKFKPTSKRSRLMDDKFSFVDATVLLNKDPQEINWDCVNKELKEIVVGCGMTRVDQRKKESEKERRWEDVRHSGSLQSYYDDQVKSTELVVRDQTQEVRSDVVYSPWVSVKRDGAVETQTCISRRANHVWKPGGFVHPKIQLDWLERADSNHEKESNKKLRKLKLHQGRKSHKTWMFKYKSEFPRHYGVDIEAFFGVEFYELEYRKLHISHCFAVLEFYGIHGSISGPWHLAFDPGGIISCTACEDFVVTHTQWVGHDKLEGCSNVQTLATDVDVEEKQAYVSVLQAVIEIHQDSHFVFLAGYDVRALEILQVGDNGAETVGAEQFQHNKVEEVSLSMRKNDRVDVILSHQGKQTLTRQKKKNWRTTWRFKLGESQFVLLLGDESFQIKHKWRFKLLPLILECELYSDCLVLVTNYAQQFDISFFFSTNLEVKVSSREGDLLQENGHGLVRGPSLF